LMAFLKGETDLHVVDDFSTSNLALYNAVGITHLFFLQITGCIPECNFYPKEGTLPANDKILLERMKRAIDLSCSAGESAD
jgi:hypothetical protein